VTLSRQQDGVARRGAADGMRNSLQAVLDACVVHSFLPADLLRTCGDLAQDDAGILVAAVLLAIMSLLAWVALSGRR